MPPTHNEILTSQRLTEYETNAAYVWMYVRFREEGLACLEPDGTIEGKPGLEVMNMVLHYFIDNERYERCVVMRDRMAEYCKKMPLQTELFN
jgi:hypothetical protein